MIRMIIHTRLLVTALATVLVTACAGTPQRESTGEFIDDTAITTRVKTALLADTQVSGITISVETFKGTVQLSGFANTLAERDKATDVAKSVAGVKAVKNDIRLK